MTSFLPVLTPKVIGVAIARYDFSSRDTRELSLQEGDVVKIYTKTGANGWWRGEVNGRVSGSFNSVVSVLNSAVKPFNLILGCTKNNFFEEE